MSALDREDEFEIFLKRRRILLRSHLSGVEPLEPPPELDRFVLRQARLAIVPPLPLAAPAPPRRRWAFPAGVAATVTVCLMLVVDLGIHALRTSVSPAPTLHETALSVPHSDDATASVTVTDDTDTSGDTYSTAYYPRLASNGPASAPIFEVVIRSARLATSRATHSADAASR